MIIGITGKIGSGKTTYAKKLTEHMPNAVHINADNIAKQIINNDENMIANSILNVPRENWTQNRFCIPYLEHFVSVYLIPAIKEIEQQKTVIFDAPLLVELNLHKICDRVVIIDSDYDTRLSRVTTRDNRSKESFDSLDSMQYDTDIKIQIVKNAIVIDNPNIIGRSIVKQTINSNIENLLTSLDY